MSVIYCTEQLPFGRCSQERLPPPTDHRLQRGTLRDRRSILCLCIAHSARLYAARRPSVSWRIGSKRSTGRNCVQYNSRPTVIRRRGVDEGYCDLRLVGLSHSVMNFEMWKSFPWGEKVFLAVNLLSPKRYKLIYRIVRTCSGYHYEKNWSKSARSLSMTEHVPDVVYECRGEWTVQTLWVDFKQFRLQ